MAEFKNDVVGDLAKSTRNVRMARLDSGINFEEEAFCEEKSCKAVKIGAGEQTETEGGARQRD